MHKYYIAVCIHSCMQMLVHGVMCCLACPQVSCGVVCSGPVLMEDVQLLEKLSIVSGL